MGHRAHLYANSYRGHLASAELVIKQATQSARREEWGEDESQDIRFDDIVSSIIREVPSRAPPTPRSVSDDNR